ncbi:MAG: HAMP domain-containing histidine kinase [Bacteroidetes bacterium]|nr:HAMP domain-containing histidine kinase [Bacteroidota bacterium]MBS1741357.1 HAMP domain-containing histidine kinase [Bacteroidota bacterium]MBS1775162.1 HAMP domain-containing histidine kinase [Bacteroidota bacterium]
MGQYFNWKTNLAFIALFIVGASLYYTNELAKKLATEERKKVELLAASIKTLATATNNDEVTFAQTFVSQNTTIPLIITDEQNNILDQKNVDTTNVGNVSKQLKRKLEEFRRMHAPIVADYGIGHSYIYYGESYLLTELRFYPYVQLAIIFLFLLVVLIALSAAHRSLQNQVWVGLSKETAHQLGTPLSSIEGWLELLKDKEGNEEAVNEMQKDLNRLKLVADRFSKVGSNPQMQEEDVLQRVRDMVAYMKKRAPSKVSISLHTSDEEIPMYISGPLLDWVLENLLRNALDAMDGQGRIDVRVTNTPQQVWIDVCDSGKGIPRPILKKIFNPGFTTKKRGWGLGLSLSKRIVEKYHHGSLFVKSSEIGKGTVFRIILRR